MKRLQWLNQMEKRKKEETKTRFLKCFGAKIHDSFESFSAGKCFISSEDCISGNGCAFN